LGGYARSGGFYKRVADWIWKPNNNKPRIDNDAARVLHIAELVENFHAPPFAGGVLDQPHKLITQVNFVLNEQAKKQQWEEEEAEHKRTRGAPG
jgi:hypothetical protein